MAKQDDLVTLPRYCDHTQAHQRHGMERPEAVAVSLPSGMWAYCEDCLQFAHTETRRLVPFKRSEPFEPLTAKQFCAVLARHYAGKSDDHVLSIGDYHYPEPDPSKMTIYTLPEFQAGISITVGELRNMSGVASA